MNQESRRDSEISKSELLLHLALQDAVLDFFKDAIKDNRVLWRLLICVDRSVENVLICDEMVTHLGKGRGSFIRRLIDK